MRIVFLMLWIAMSLPLSANTKPIELPEFKFKTAYKSKMTCQKFSGIVDSNYWLASEFIHNSAPVEPSFDYLISTSGWHSPKNEILIYGKEKVAYATFRATLKVYSVCNEFTNDEKNNFTVDKVFDLLFKHQLSSIDVPEFDQNQLGNISLCIIEKMNGQAIEMRNTVKEACEHLERIK